VHHSPIDAAVGAPGRLAVFVDDRVREIEPLFRRYQEASWLANVTGETRYVQESGDLDAQIRTLYSNREAFAK